MINIGANIVIIEHGKVLLTQREDFEVWCLPGGHIDAGESAAAVAIREAREETGLDVHLLRLVGVYTRLGSADDIHTVCFAAQPTGGILQAQVGEVIDLAYFAPDDLPTAMFWWHRQQISDALAGIGGSVATVVTVQPAEPVRSRQELYALRDQSGMTRPDFYHYYFEQNGQGAITREVGDDPRPPA
ncbi:MAG: NUDIX domain-containing protein [Chloroflexota bacterium]|nr:NUDIX domain-containing protein [Chloroflexota bacterium]